jgi:ligand-binding sensor domain-containing protein
MESEIIKDIGPGEREDIWIATRRGIGVFDGHKWHFPKMGPYYLEANALAHDRAGNHFIGTVKGLHCVGDCPDGAIDVRRGLLDDVVRDLAVDSRGRVWALTEHGITVVEP